VHRSSLGLNRAVYHQLPDPLDRVIDAGTDRGGHLTRGGAITGRKARDAVREGEGKEEFAVRTIGDNVRDAISGGKFEICLPPHDEWQGGDLGDTTYDGSFVQLNLLGG
jgi:hypothetical protein